MLDHLIVTIYGYALSIHRLIQLIDHCFLGDCGKCRRWSADWGIQSLYGPHHGDCHPGILGAGYTELTLPWG